MQRRYFPAVMADVKISDSGDIKEDKIAEDFEVYDFICNHSCQFTHIFVFDNRSGKYGLENIIHLSGDFRKGIDKVNEIPPLADQSDSDCLPDKSVLNN